ncbi:pilus assembly FimT family protein [Variovorax sp. LT1R20]|uniref:GspH/FimT family pseudopilin n=1 Tax=Variovorax sp. LT1R20 TaxID=3443729 RepID=UPI003F48E416
MGIVILVIAIAIGAPSFAEWINNSQIRSTAESLQNGLQFARAEAIRRNTTVRLQLTTTLDNTCAIDIAGTNWVVNVGSSNTPASRCGEGVDESSVSHILQTGQPVTGRSSATLSSNHGATFGFNGLGRMVTTASPVTAIEDGAIDIKSSKGVCAADPAGGTLRCLRVLVSAGGQIRMCDPKRGTGDPMACIP